MRWFDTVSSTRHLPTLAYSVGLGLLALAVTAIWLADTRFLQDQHRIGAEVNLAGRQRMLSQRIAFVAQDMDRFERVTGASPNYLLLGCAHQMMRAHRALLSADLDVIKKALDEGLSCHVGRPTEVGTGDLSPALQNAFFGGDQPLDKELTRFVNLASRIAEADTPDEADIEELVLRANLLLPVKLNSLVSVFQQEGEESLHWLDNFITAMWILTLIVIALEIAFIFRPMARAIRDTMDKLQQTLLVSERQKQDLQDLNEQLQESISYARKIQEGVLPDLGHVRPLVKDIAILWEPLETVSGDFVWSRELDGTLVFFVADCTGHGVPGALLTMVVSAELARLIEDGDLSRPDQLMLDLDQAVRRRLGQDGGSDRESDDGFEAALLLYHRASEQLVYVGAGIPLIVSTDGSMDKVASDRARLGYRSLRRPNSFTVHEMKVGRGDTFYLATDGATDHIGGDPKRAFGRKRLVNTLSAAQGNDLNAQLAELKSALTDYRGAEAPRDDYTVLAVRPRMEPSPLQDAAE